MPPWTASTSLGAGHVCHRRHHHHGAGPERAARRVDANSFNPCRSHHRWCCGSLSRLAGSLPVFSQASHYAINILAAEQMPLAQRLPRATSTVLPAWPGARARAARRCWRALRRCSSAPTAASTRGRPRHLRGRGGAVQRARRGHAADLPRRALLHRAADRFDDGGLRGEGRSLG